MKKPQYLTLNRSIPQKSYKLLSCIIQFEVYLQNNTLSPHTNKQDNPLSNYA